MKPITEKQSQKWPLLFLFSAAVLVMLIGVICNLKWGQAYVSWRTLFEAVTYQGSDKAHLYIQTLRLPRAIMACIVGMQLALAGMLTQITTKNPLASPHIFGINAGAALAVVIGLVALPHFGNCASGVSRNHDPLPHVFFDGRFHYYESACHGQHDFLAGRLPESGGLVGCADHFAFLHRRDGVIHPHAASFQAAAA
jgi:hypothetical protein